MIKYIIPFISLTAILLASCQKTKTNTPGPGPIDPADTTSNHLVYAASGNGKLYAFNANDGSIKWTFTLNDTISWTPQISSPTLVDSTIYIGSTDKNIYAINAYTGAEKWHYTTTSLNGFFSSSPVVANKVVYVGAYASDSRFYAINATNGQLIWSKSFGSSVGFESSPTVANNIIYVEANHILYALNTTDGSVRWQYNGSSLDFGYSSPCVKDGVVFDVAQGAYAAGSNNSRLIVLNANNGGFLGGRVGYSFPFRFVTYNSAILDDSIAYLAGEDSGLYAIQTYYLGIDNKVWKYKAADEFYGSPTYDDSCVFAGTANGVLYAIRKSNGTFKWKYDTRFLGTWNMMSSPIVANGVVFAGTSNGFVAVDAKTGIERWHQTIPWFDSSPCLITKQGIAVHSAISGMRN